LDQAKAIVEKGHDSPTEFEILTAIALLYFCEKQCDFVVLEVGLGGSGDSTNVVKEPLVSVITSISYDHMDRLGDTLTQIAAEKAGIIKRGVPVVSGVGEPEAAKVIAKTAYAHECTLYDATKIPVSNEVTSMTGSRFDAVIWGTNYGGVQISMPGRHQVENAMIALTAIEILRKKGIIKVTRAKLYAGIKRAVQPGRLELVCDRPTVILDGAHNEAGASALADAVADYYPGRKIHMVVGILADKQVDKMLDHFIRMSDNFVATQPDSARKIDAQVLAEKLIDRRVNCQVRKDPKEAYKLAASQAGPEGVIVIAGSLFLIGALRERRFNE
jgi:dihydrofolate synthase/folylpolyglutamate synthase